MKNRFNTEMIKAYEDVYKYLESKGYKPQLNVSDNECSKTIQEFLTRLTLLLPQMLVSP